MSAPIKRKQLTLEVKMQILQEFDKGWKQTDVARMFDIEPTTLLSTILKDREKIVNLYEHSVICPGRKRLRLRD
jgi:hypothetical protein